MGVQIIDTDMQGPLEKNTAGLIIGRSSSTLRGLIVLPGVIDPDYEGVIKVMCYSPFGVISISPGDRVAQLLILQSGHEKYPAQSHDRGASGFGSTGIDLACLSMELDDRPMLQIEVEGKHFSGLVDTGADRSVMSKQFWPKGWPLQHASQDLVGLGYRQAPEISSKELHWTVDKQQGTFRPFVVDLPINLWGRDIQTQMKLILTNEYSQTSKNIMARQGYMPNKGLGKNLQGISEPVELVQKTDRKGVGFS